jgi:nucleoside-diphosphate-sugar epimerase
LVFDIENIDYKSVFEGNDISCVIHTATSYGRKGETLSSIYDANLFFPVKLLENCIKYGVKYFFNASTALPADLNVYALSKKQFSDVLKLNHGLFKVIDLELQYFYGPGDDTSKFVSFVISKILNGDESIDLSPGTQIRDFIYIEDVISAYLTLINKINDLPNYIRVPLGSGEGFSLRSLTQQIRELIGDNDTALNFDAMPLRAGEIMYSVADISLLHSLGWRPQYNLKEGLIETINREKSLHYDYNK